MVSDDVVSCFASKFEIKLSQTFKNVFTYTIYDIINVDK